MIHPSKLTKIWFLLGLIFLGIGSYNVLWHGHISSLLTVAVGGLIMYSSAYQMGGWWASWYEIKAMFAGMFGRVFKRRLKRKKPAKKTGEVRQFIKRK